MYLQYCEIGLNLFQVSKNSRRAAFEKLFKRIFNYCTFLDFAKLSDTVDRYFTSKNLRLFIGLMLINPFVPIAFYTPDAYSN